MPPKVLRNNHVLLSHLIYYCPIKGLDAASSFIQGYWVWAKIIENLAVVNYDTANNLFLAAYDWRLSYGNLEIRDAYFSRLKMTIEGLKWVFLVTQHCCLSYLDLSTMFSQEETR